MDELREAIAGTVVIPSDPDWDAARQAWNLTADQQPAVVVRAGALDDIGATRCASPPPTGSGSRPK